MGYESINFERTSLGIELGSTRIKAVLIDENHRPIASGEYKWENRFEKGVWTYDLKDVWEGVQKAFSQVAKEVKSRHQITLSKVGSIGISGMMHGYLPFDGNGNQLAPFRTWRNTITETAAEKLTSLFKFNIPHRWSIAHLYQAILNEEEHVRNIGFLTTLSGYVHWKLTGEKVLGIGEASGMFPVNYEDFSYDIQMMAQFEELIDKYNYSWTLKEILPKIQLAGTEAGQLTKEGALLLDPEGNLQPGIPFCPPEGDAGTGMVATNSISEYTGNISAGTSVFAMIVLEKPLSNYYKEVDVVATPVGKPVAMVHCNNFTSDINAWADLFAEVIEVFGKKVDKDELFTILFQTAIEADEDVGKLVSCNYYSGEPITGLEEGRPLFVRMPDSKLTLPNFMKAHIYSALATLKIGMDLLMDKEKVQIDYLLGHGGFFKTEKVSQQIMTDALQVPVSVMSTAGEGGPWGMAILAAYAINHEGLSLEEYLAKKVFAKEEMDTINPSNEGIKSFTTYMERYQAVLDIERTAAKVLQ